MPFTELFGNKPILPANNTFIDLTLTESIVLQWPTEQQIGGDDVLGAITQLNSSTPGLTVTLSDARVVSQGYTALFNNVGAQTITIAAADGSTIISLVSGTAWMIYLEDNSTEAGVWRTFQFGASVSVTNAAALAGAGLKAITTTLNTRILVSAKAVNYNILNADRAILLLWTSGVGTFNLPDATTVGADWYTIVRNSGSGNLTVAPPSGTIDGQVSRTFAPGSSAFVVSDGTNYFTIGFGSGVSGGGSGFGFVAINVAGSGNYVLSGAELSQVGYRFTGVLTGDRNIVVPGTTDEYWVDNQTTGAFRLFVKTLAQVPGIEVLQNNRNILYCDGTNVIAAESATVSFPIPVAQGGTGAVTAAAARTNLGATVTGAALFTAVDAAAARTAIAAVPTSRAVNSGAGLTGGGDLTADRTLAVDFTNTYFPIMKRKTGNTSRASTTVQTADPDLTGWVLQPSSTYHVHGVLVLGSNGATNNGFAWSWLFNGATTNMNFTGGGILFMRGYNTGLSDEWTIQGGQAGSFAFTQVVATKLVIVDYLFATGAGFTPGGLLTFNWAQQTSSASGTRIDADSYLIVERVN